MYALNGTFEEVERAELYVFYEINWFNVLISGKKEFILDPLGYFDKIEARLYAGSN